ncbi:MAG TPA: ABC transporter permease [Candidatus Limnocylindrales bacterium]|nr:ABC transporter permease [Candidatus Limnocylindrales bacterium]
MLGFIGRRIAQSIPTLILISALLFFGMQLIPGGPLAAFSFNRGMSEAARQAIIHQWGLDQPVHIQYFKWLKSMVTGTWGTSFFLHRPVREVILQRLPATAILMTTAYLLQQVVALPAGIIAALRRYSFFDQAVTFFSYVGYSMPTFWLGLMLLLIFAVFIPILPVAGVVDIRTAGAPFLTNDYNVYFGQHPVQALVDILRHIILPATTIAIVGIAGDSRFMRASMLDAIHQDYIRTARAKGLSERTVVLKHALRNALLPVVTNIAIELPLLFSGAVVTESIYSWPGMGQAFFQALEAYDYPLLMGILTVSATLIVFFNIVADVAYALIDPRISYA